MKISFRVASLLAVVATFGLFACSDDSGGTVDSGGKKDGLYPDLGLPDDLGQKAPCESEWIDALSAQKKVTTGAVATTESAGVYTTTVDASAGGMNGASSNPFVYISLKDGTRVDITDIESRTSTAWDLAIRRTVIRTNGGDSGAGGGGVARVPGKKLADVTAVPAGVTFKVDDFLDASCKILRDPINLPLTTFSDPAWYEYTVGTSAVKPLDILWIIRRADGSFVKLVIDNYYNGSNQGGHFTLRWSAL